MKTPIQLLLPVVALLCTSCAAPDFGPRTDQLLNAAFVKEQFGASAYPDIGSGTRCDPPVQVSVTVIEDRRGPRTLSSFPPVAVKYEDIAASVQRYFVDALREAKVQVASAGGLAIEVRVVDMTMTTGWGPAAGSTTLAVSIPAWSYAGTYMGEEVSGTVARGIAYSVHMAVAKFLADPLVLDRLRCKAGQ